MSRHRASLLFGALLLCSAGVASATAARPVTYAVNVNTSSISGTTGSLDFNFNPGPLVSQAASIQILGFSTNGVLTGVPALTGDATGALPAVLTFDNLQAFNDYFQSFTFGTALSFTVSLYGPALSSPDGVSTSGSTFAFSMFSDAAGTVPVLTTDLVDGFALTVNVNLDGTTTFNNLSPAINSLPPNPPSGPTAAPPVLTAAFGAASVPFGGATSLTFTLSNPNPSAPLTGIRFTDNLPSGLVVATPNNLSGSCLVAGGVVTGAGTVTASAASGSIGLIGLSLLGNASCSFSLSVSAVGLGVQNNLTSVVSAGQTGSGLSASSAITVTSATQTITFGTLPSHTYGDAKFNLSATASSGLAVTFAATSGPCSVSSLVVTITGAGNCVITASQAGNTNYAAAPGVSQTFAINPAPLTVTASSATIAAGAALPAFTVSYAGFVNGDTSAVLSGAPSLTTTATASSLAGTYPVVATAGTLAAANYSFSFVNGTLTVTGPASIDNSATFVAGAVAPNTILTLFGTALSCTPSPQVLVNGSSAQVLFSNSTQINFVVPDGTSSGTSATIQITCNNAAIGTVTVPLAAVDPAIFTQTGSGSGPGSIVNQDGTVNTAGNPASLGSFISVYVTGFGPFNAPSSDGLQRLTYPVTATIGGVTATVIYAGEAPGETSGLQQINIQIPANAPVGPSVPIALTANGVITEAGITVSLQ